MIPHVIFRYRIGVCLAFCESSPQVDRSFLYLNVISWGLLLNSVPKIYSILLNNRRHLKVSHNQRINTAEFLRIPPSCGPRIFEACTGKVHKKSKNYASRRGPIEHLVIILQTPQGVCKKLNLTLQGGPQVAECPRVICQGSRTLHAGICFSAG